VAAVCCGDGRYIAQTTFKCNREMTIISKKNFKNIKPVENTE